MCCKHSLSFAACVIGPDKLPEFAHKFGKTLALFRKAYRSAAEELTGEDCEKGDTAL